MRLHIRVRLPRSASLPAVNRRADSSCSPIPESSLSKVRSITSFVIRSPPDTATVTTAQSEANVVDRVSEAVQVYVNSTNRETELVKDESSQGQLRKTYKLDGRTTVNITLQNSGVGGAPNVTNIVYSESSICPTNLLPLPEHSQPVEGVASSDESKINERSPPDEIVDGDPGQLPYTEEQLKSAEGTEMAAMEGIEAKETTGIYNLADMSETNPLEEEMKDMEQLDFEMQDRSMYHCWGLPVFDDEKEKEHVPGEDHSQIHCWGMLVHNRRASSRKSSERKVSNLDNMYSLQDKTEPLQSDIQDVGSDQANMALEQTGAQIAADVKPTTMACVISSTTRLSTGQSVGSPAEVRTLDRVNDSSETWLYQSIRIIALGIALALFVIVLRRLASMLHLME